MREILARLRATGGRITSGRVAILRALVAGHHSAEEVLRAVPGTSRATVYKTLDALKALGEVQELDTGAGAAHYDALRPEPHAHALCPRCGRIEDIELPSFDRLAREAESQGYSVESVRLDVIGPCAACLRRDSP